MAAPARQAQSASRKCRTQAAEIAASQDTRLPPTSWLGTEVKWGGHLPLTISFYLLSVAEPRFGSES